MEEKIAIAIKQGEQAPEVLAAATGEAAQQMLEIAQAHEIKVIEDEAKLEEYFKLKSQGLPLEIYEVVSEVLRFINQAHHAWINQDDIKEEIAEKNNI